VIGEYERAFYGSQFASMAPLFEHYGIQLWTPEVGGRVDFGSEDHEQMMMALGLQSKREITRTRIRVRTAMAAQTREQGRHLGGRPPYGYRLADAGPHPNRAHAAWGRRARRLEPDPETAPQVAWIFAERLAGHSMARIARALNDAAVPCPSAADPQRNPHRTGNTWTLHTVRAILGNPRYTGRQVWNLPEGWVISARPAHPAIVTEADFIAAQDLGARRGPDSPSGIGPKNERCLPPCQRPLQHRPPTRSGAGRRYLRSATRYPDRRCSTCWSSSCTSAISAPDESVALIAASLARRGCERGIETDAKRPVPCPVAKEQLLQQQRQLR